MSSQVPAGDAGGTGNTIDAGDAGDRNTRDAGKAAISNFPSSMLRGNPNCDECGLAFQRSQKRHQEKMAAIREAERLKQQMNRQRLDHEDYIAWTEREIQRLKQEAANMAQQLEHQPANTGVLVEQYQGIIAQKVNQLQALHQQKEAEIHEAHEQEKQALTEQLESKQKGLDTEKSRKEFLERGMAAAQEEVLRVPGLKAEVSELKSASSSLQKQLDTISQDKNELEEQKAKLQDDLDKKDKELAWMKNQMRKREEEHRLAMSPKKDYLEQLRQAHVHQLQPSTPTPHRATLDPSLNMTGASPSTMTHPLQTPNRWNGTTASRTPGTPQNVNLSSRRGSASYSKNNSHLHSTTGTTFLNGQNGVATPIAMRHQNHSSPLTAEYIHEHSGTPLLDRRSLMSSPAGLQPPSRQLFPSSSGYSSASQIATQRSAPTTASEHIGRPNPAPISKTPQQNHLQQLSPQQRQHFGRWLPQFVLNHVMSKYAASGSLAESERDMFSTDPKVSARAVQVACRQLMNNTVHEASILRKYHQELGRFQQGQKAAHTGMHTATAQASAFNGAASNARSGFENIVAQNPAAAGTRTEPYDIPSASPRRSPRVQASQLASTRNHPQNGGQLPNPMQQPQSNIFQQYGKAALANMNAMRQTPNANSFPISGPPQKQTPSVDWNPPMNNTNLFDNAMPQFPQPVMNGGFQQPNNQAFYELNDGLRMFNHNFALGMNDSGVDDPFQTNFGNAIHVNNNSRGQMQNHIDSGVLNNVNGQFQNMNSGIPQGNFNGQVQNNNEIPIGLDDLTSLPELQQYGTQMHPADQHPVPSSSETRSPSRSQSRASDLRWGDPKDIPNGGYAGPVCLNCHQNWWNTWCDDSPDGCYNCQAKNEICRRPQCENLHNCQNKNCKRAHASDQFVDTYPAPKNGPKRNSKKGDDHEEPPRKRQAGLAGAEYPGLRA